MISHNQTKLITGLKQKKYRDKYRLFVAEGPKVIAELLGEGMKLKHLYALEDAEMALGKTQLVTPAELKKISFLRTPNSALAIFEIPEPKPHFESGLIVAVDALRDPGNMGTIIRLCDWFGVSQLVCSEDSVDCYNPKVVQASMGSLARVQVHYLPLSVFLKRSRLPIYGGFMDGRSIYSEALPLDAILVMGNEANGISEEIAELISHRVSIPRYGRMQKTESLNVATATAILLSEFRRSIEK